MADVRLLIVIVNFRVAPLVVDCLHSIAAELTKVPDTRVVVFENGSRDNSAKTIESAIQRENWQNWCRLDVSAENLGFTGGNNQPIRDALLADDPPDYFLLLNPDTIVRPGALAALVRFMEYNPHVGIAGSRLEDPDGTPQRSAFRFKTPLGELESHACYGVLTRWLAKSVIAPPVTKTAIQADWVAGASMIVRRIVFDDVGLLDEGLFTYYDDIDLCLAARRFGWTTWYVPDSRVVHLVGQSTGVNTIPKRLPAYMLEARRRFFLKNYSRSYALLVDTCMLVGVSLALLRGLLSGKPAPSPPHMLIDSFRHSVFACGFRVPVVQSPERSRT